MLDRNFKDKLFYLVKDLGKEAEQIKNQNHEVYYKEDTTPLTYADMLINKELCSLIMTSNYKNIISEESKLPDYKIRKNWKYFWVIDPIDGTKEYVNKGKDYTINIALCLNTQPIFSVIYAPARDELFHAEINKGSFKNNSPIRTKKKLGKSIRLVASKSHLSKETEEYIQKLKRLYLIDFVQYASSLKICRIAEGTADLYPRFGPTMEWDTCAADLILQEAGGCIANKQNLSLAYNKKNLYNPSFIAVSQKKYLKIITF